MIPCLAFLGQGKKKLGRANTMAIGTLHTFKVPKLNKNPIKLTCAGFLSPASATHKLLYIAPFSLTKDQI